MRKTSSQKDQLAVEQLPLRCFYDHNNYVSAARRQMKKNRYTEDKIYNLRKRGLHNYHYTVDEFWQFDPRRSVQTMRKIRYKQNTEIMYIISYHIKSFYDFSIGFWNCSYTCGFLISSVKLLLNDRIESSGYHIVD